MFNNVIKPENEFFLEKWNKVITKTIGRFYELSFLGQIKNFSY